MDSTKLFILAFTCSIVTVTARPEPQFHWDPFFMELMKIPEILQGALMAGAGWSLPEDNSHHQYHDEIHVNFAGHENENSGPYDSDFDNYSDNYHKPEKAIVDSDPESIEDIRQPLRWTSPNNIRRAIPNTRKRAETTIRQPFRGFLPHIMRPVNLDIISFNPDFHGNAESSIVDLDPELSIETIAPSKGFLPDIKTDNPDYYKRPETTIVDWDRELIMDYVNEPTEKVIKLLNPVIVPVNPVSPDEEIRPIGSADPPEDVGSDTGVPANDQ